LGQLTGSATAQVGRIIEVYRYNSPACKITDAAGNCCDRARTEYSYCYAGWQLVEVRNGSDLAERQFVWPAQYIDEGICTAPGQFVRRRANL